MTTTRDTQGRYAGSTEAQKAKEARASAYAKAMVETGSERAAEAAVDTVTDDKS